MADDIKSLAARIQKLEAQVKGMGTSMEELERKGKYLQGILDTQNKMGDRMDSAEKRLDALSKK